MIDPNSEELKTWERRFKTAKEKHRPKLKNWERDGFGTSRLQDFKALQDLDHGAVDVLELPPSAVAAGAAVDAAAGPLGIYRIGCASLSYHDFIRYFERPAIPCVITDVPREEGWEAAEKWDRWSYFRSMKDSFFKVGEDDDGYSVKTRMRYFLDYMKHNRDDSPLYVFDSRFDEDRTAKVLLTDYSVPSYFPEDLFSLVGERRRPPYRWFLAGPARSGTCVHIDPLGTSAWNTVLRGHKRWVLFPPSTPKSIAKGLDVIKKGEDDEAVNYFVDILPRIKEKWGHVYQITEFTQGPGDTAFVPGGWWHAVINLDDTVAITQNYCSSENFDRVWVRTRSGRKKMSVKMLRELRSRFPVLADRAEALNRRDGFVMYGDRVSSPEPSSSSERKKSSKKKKSSSREQEEHRAGPEGHQKKKKRKNE